MSGEKKEGEVGSTLVWRSRRIGFNDVPFTRRSVGTDKFSDDPQDVFNNLIFEGQCTTSGFGLGMPLRIVGSDHEIGEARIRIEVQRRTREGAKKWTAGMVHLQEHQDAFENERSRRIAGEWDTDVWFEGIGTQRVSILVGTYAEPSLFDRFVTLSLDRCVAHVWLQMAVLVPFAEAQGLGSGDTGKLPAIRPDSDGRIDKSSTHAVLADLGVVQGPVP